MIFECTDEDGDKFHIRSKPDGTFTTYINGISGCAVAYLTGDQARELGRLLIEHVPPIDHRAGDVWQNVANAYRLAFVHEDGFQPHDVRTDNPVEDDALRAGWVRIYREASC